MTQDEIIELAVLAGLEQDGDMWFSNLYKTDMDVHINHLEAFAKLVEDKVRDDIIEKNKPVLQSVNDYIKKLEDEVKMLKGKS
jgi:hypothetical protein